MDTDRVSKLRRNSPGPVLKESKGKKMPGHEEQLWMHNPKAGGCGTGDTAQWKT